MSSPVTDIDEVAIKVLRTLAAQCAEAGHQVGIAPETLAALLDRIEASDQDIHLRDIMLEAIGLPWEIDSKAGLAMSCYQVLVNSRSIERISDQAVAVTFPSCRLATVFEQLASTAKEG
jgi:hypothetical protein